MSVAWNLRLPYLYSSAVPGREWQDYLISPLLEGKTRGTFQEKSAWFAYLLKEPPRELAQSCRPTQKKQQQENCSINVKIRSSTGLSGPITPQKSPTTASTRKKFLPDQPTSQHVVQQCIPDLRHVLCLLQSAHTHTHTRQIYHSSSTRTVHLVPLDTLKRYSRISSASVLPPTWYAMWDVAISTTAAVALLKPQEKRRQQAKPAAKKKKKKNQSNNNSPSPTLPYPTLRSY